MLLMRLGPAGHERDVACVSDPLNDTDDLKYVELPDALMDTDLPLFGDERSRELRDLVRTGVRLGRARRLDGERIGAPIKRPHQILCVGLNYYDHANETAQDVPAEPLIFNKAPNTLVGPRDAVVYPRGATKLDYEVELGVVIGRRCSYLASSEDAHRVIAGFVVVNDISERAFQMERGGQWVKGKSSPTFNPCGPFLVTPEEIEDPQALNIWLRVNGETRQSAQTSSMIHGIFDIVRYVSQFMVLEPGDLINTGTPAGVGMGRDPEEYLKIGDVLELGIDGLGSQRQEVVAEPSQALPSSTPGDSPQRPR